MFFLGFNYRMSMEDFYEAFLMDYDIWLSCLVKCIHPNHHYPSKSAYIN
jgi:hypothetical protein